MVIVVIGLGMDRKRENPALTVCSGHCGSLPGHGHALLVAHKIDVAVVIGHHFKIGILDRQRRNENRPESIADILLALAYACKVLGTPVEHY